MPPPPFQVHSRTDVLHILLDSGADVNLLDGCGISALNACYHVEYAARTEVNYHTVCLCTVPILTQLLSDLRSSPVSQDFHRSSLSG